MDRQKEKLMTGRERRRNTHTHAYTNRQRERDINWHTEKKTHTQIH